MERVWRHAVTAYFEVLPRHLPGGTEANRAKRQSAQSGFMVYNEDRRSRCKTFLHVSGHCFQEYDHPYILLQRRNSYFYKLVQETGPAMADQLLKVAQQVRQYLLLSSSMTDLLNQWIIILQFETKYLHIFLQKHKGFFFSLTHIRIESDQKY